MDQPEKRKLEDAASSRDETPDKRPRVIGPALPPSHTESPAQQSHSEDDGSSSDDDDFGPSLPPPEGSVPAAAPAQTSRRETPPSEKEQAPPQARRDDWMLLPPDGSDWSSKVDPTKLKNRKFQSGKPGASRGAPGGVDASWTETPEQKMRRLQDQVMGVSVPSAGGEREAGPSKRSLDMDKKVQKYNEARKKEGSLGSSQSHKDAKKEEDDDPSSRAFDREKDMALSSKITSAQRRDMINKAGDFGSRFSKGNYL